MTTKRHMELKNRDCELNVERRWPMTPDCSNELNKGSTETNDQNGVSVAEDDCEQTLEFELKRNYETYKHNVKMREQISSIIAKENILEDSLTKQHKFCLELFRAQRPAVDVKSAELRLWQYQLLDIVTEGQMNDRKIVWIKGADGNEGKSCFQSYLQSFYGSHRVARFDITNKTSDLLHIISRCALETTDIFLFNHQRCVSSEDCCYSLLEMVKDGYASSTKYHGSLLRIKTPNLVIVFSNRDPRVRSLSKDRWKIYFITADGLTADHEEWMWERQTDDFSAASGKEKKQEIVYKIA